MGKENNVKQLRGQLRQIVKELMPDLIKLELYNDLQKANSDRINKIANNFDELVKSVNERVEQTLKEINDRSKDVQDFVMRQAASPALSLPNPENKGE